MEGCGVAYNRGTSQKVFSPEYLQEVEILFRLISIEKAPDSEPLDNMLPTEAVNKGYGLSWWSPAVFEKDPVFLYKQGREVYRWGYVPSMTEVWEKIEELEQAF